MFANLEDEAQERAEDCRREARNAIKAADVLAWLSLADEWRKLADVQNVDCTVIAAPQPNERAPAFAAA
jgi:hypothetical protein